MQAFLLALQLMTRLPVKLDKSVYADERLAGRSVLYYPVVGLVIGLVLVAVSYLLTGLGLQEDSLLLAALVLAVWVFITGALHLDGLGDSADAWLGGYGDPQRTLEIMKDPYCGPAAVVSIGLVLIVKFSALVEINNEYWVGLILTPVLARASVIALFMTTSYVRKNGMGELAALNIPGQQAWFVLMMVVVACFLITGLKAFWIILFVAMLFYFLRQLMLQRIGGMTGDTAGALIEVIETCVLVIVIL